MYNVIILNTIYEDIYDIYDFCCNISTKYATKVINNIFSSMYSLSYFPYANPQYPIIGNFVLRKKVVKSRYLIIYSISKNSVFIYRVYDSRRNIQPNDLFNIN